MTLLCLLLAAAATEAPDTYVLEAGMPVWDVASGDLDGNGKADVLALCADVESRPLRKRLSVYLSGDGNGYPSRPSFNLELAPDTGSVFLTELDGKAPLELAVTDAEGAQIYAYGDGGLRVVRKVEFASLLPSRVKKPIFLEDIAVDLDGDGIDEWLVPVPTGFEIRSADGLLGRVEADVVNSMESGEVNRVIHRLPSAHTFDLPGQTRKGVVFLSDQYADFAHGERWSQQERYKVPLDLREKWVAVTRMKDIDENGLPDLIVAQTQGTVNLKVLTQVYFAKEPFTFSKTPDATFQVSGALTTPFTEDVDGDGKSDLLFIKVPFGVKMFVNYFVTQKLPIQVEAHLFKDGRFGESPELRASISIDAPENRRRVAYTMGDFNGDGRIDVAFGSGEDGFVIHVGEEDRLISVKPWQALKVPSAGEARAYDLNGNKAEDIVLFHPSSPDEKRIDVAVF